MPTPKVIVFDVNETLLDLTPLKVSVGKALGGREDLLPLWFSTMLHYSLVETLSGSYHGFGEIGSAALRMLAEKHGIELSGEGATASIVPALQSLPPHADVVAGLKALAAQGGRLVTLSNSSSDETSAALRNAGLIDLLEQSYSVESVRKYKPHPDVYNGVLSDLGVQPHEVLMVAAHAWDLMGAKNVGLQTAFVKRPGAIGYPLAQQPDHVVEDLLQLAEVLS
ncbi:MULTISPECIES: haloacid dehalogenase type II [unclassified Lentimonas]|uniref:haloacid dehalogenase type II n=1 Tax=unclassified Lentimonas TaxID=2630993 RepID=UPI001321EFBA|nr:MULTISPECIES: haloacid dehalogenase type II [unclassified Lentimonas]CAA6677246.1 haloacid dehalogenase, type II [Lentimonas sp. CC4]CAA6686129.1 haloacid dehalogenase, type II [Lentimonas sp. CC6]CAA7074161.1 haloacid dehalogenase, type II [Lentimonas sp. CC4]CAA7171519.1 haloacid dehalogenase, type II [Lentimonas sp. CC21]CAA7181997.1 haloacid dehalogenase, type II [Lentimonas sp. CC8]